MKLFSHFILLFVLCVIFCKPSYANDSPTTRRANMSYKSWDGSRPIAPGILGSPPPNDNKCNGGGDGDKALTFDISIFANNDVNNIYFDVNAWTGSFASSIWRLDWYRRGYNGIPPLGGLEWANRSKISFCVGQVVQALIIDPPIQLGSIFMWYDGPVNIDPNPPDNADTNTGDNYTNLSGSTTSSGSSSSSKPELFVKELSFKNGKTKYYDDETINIDGYVKNGGKGVSSKIDKISFRLYRFKGEKENGDTKEVGDENIKGSNLGSGDTKHEEFSFSAPDDEDKYQFYGVIDAKNTVAEANENNNRSDTITCRVHNRPDIKVDDLVFDDGRVQFMAGEVSNVRATFTNSGGEPFEDVPVSWYLDGNHYADDNIRHWNIEHGDEKHEDVNIDTSILGAGTHTLRVCADFSEDKNNSDNWRELAFEVQAIQQSKDVVLLVSTVQLTNTSLPVPTNNFYGAAMTIRNIGQDTSTSEISGSFEIKGPGTNDQWVIVAEESNEDVELPPEQDRLIETTALIPTPIIPGSYELRGCADYKNTITETSESNNCATTAFEVTSEITSEIPPTIPTTPTQVSVPLDMINGWNLLASTIGIKVSKVFGDSDKFSSVWKWENGTWAVYLPSSTDSGVSYAQSNGFSNLTIINPGEGFWVNATGAKSATITGTPKYGELTLASGWNLVGLKSTQATTAADLVASTPGIVSLWKMTNGNWSMHLTSEVNNPGAYAKAKGFIPLTTINPGEGFWASYKPDQLDLGGDCQYFKLQKTSDTSSLVSYQIIFSPTISGTIGVVGQSAPDSAWIEYPVVGKTVTISNWPKGKPIEFSAYYLDAQGNKQWLDAQLCPADFNGSAIPTDQHFKVNLN